MRLIDADKLETTAVLGVQLQHADSRYYYFYEEETIQNAPTVKAIPIEWIKKWCNEHNRKSLEERLLKRYGVITLLEDWEKENG